MSQEIEPTSEETLKSIDFERVYRAQKAAWHEERLLHLEHFHPRDRDADAEKQPPPSPQPDFHPPSTTIPPSLLFSFPIPFSPIRSAYGQCVAAGCPVRKFHLDGLYYDNYDQPAEGPWPPRTEWFGDSEAPREVWAAVRRLEEAAAGKGTKRPEDEKMVSRFRECHYFVFPQAQPHVDAEYLAWDRGPAEPHVEASGAKLKEGYNRG